MNSNTNSASDQMVDDVSRKDLSIRILQIRDEVQSFTGSAIAVQIGERCGVLDAETRSPLSEDRAEGIEMELDSMGHAMDQIRRS